MNIVFVAPQVRYKTSASRVLDEFWMTVTELTSYSVRVKAAEDAKLYLTEIPGVTTREAYQIVIGYKGSKFDTKLFNLV